MSQQRRMYIGTESGVVVLAERDGLWQPERECLDGTSSEMMVAANPDHTIYAAIANEGVYASRDDGASWDRVLDGDVRALAVDPANPRTVYAGTEPVHVHRTMDGGRTWQEIESLQRMPEEVQEQWWFPIYPHESHVKTIVVNPHDSRIIHVGLEHGGIVRTFDAGETWDDVSEGIDYLDIHMVAADPMRKERYYAGAARGFYRSNDYGRDWIMTMDGMTRDYMHDFVVQPGAAPSVFVATANGTPPAWQRNTKAEGAIFRSNDGGQSWQQLRGGLPDSMERMAWNIVVDPLDENRLYAGVGDYTPNLAQGEAGAGEIWVSGDRGDHWTKIHDTQSPVRALCVGLA